MRTEAEFPEEAAIRQELSKRIASERRAKNIRGSAIADLFAPSAGEEARIRIQHDVAGQIVNHVPGMTPEALFRKSRGRVTGQAAAASRDDDVQKYFENLGVSLTDAQGKIKDTLPLLLEVAAAQKKFGGVNVKRSQILAEAIKSGEIRNGADVGSLVRGVQAQSLQAGQVIQQAGLAVRLRRCRRTRKRPPRRRTRASLSSSRWKAPATSRRPCRRRARCSSSSTRSLAPTGHPSRRRRRHSWGTEMADRISIVVPDEADRRVVERIEYEDASQDERNVNGTLMSLSSPGGKKMVITLSASGSGVLAAPRLDAYVPMVTPVTVTPRQPSREFIPVGDSGLTLDMDPVAGTVRCRTASGVSVPFTVLGCVVTFPAAAAVGIVVSTARRCPAR